ncbi:MAG: hypothetical protein IJK98_09320, partial [Clostridia bacterium]|nr:hypothetical protein [Clostridia bacterium]
PAVLRGVKEFLAAKQVGITESAIEDAVIFEDAYTGGGYGRGDHAAVVDRIMRRYGMPLDEIYTGKAFAGMGEYLKTHGIKEKNILFINTGSVPLYFDALLKTGADAADGNVITV